MYFRPSARIFEDREALSPLSLYSGFTYVNSTTVALAQWTREPGKNENRNPKNLDLVLWICSCNDTVAMAYFYT